MTVRSDRPPGLGRGLAALIPQRGPSATGSIDIPLARIIGDLERAGYQGLYDLELIGPRIESEGYDGAIARSITALDRLLDEVSDGAARR